MATLIRSYDIIGHHSSITNEHLTRYSFCSLFSPDIKTIETVVFIPSTPNSPLRKKLQEANDQLCLAINSPSVRFVKKRGQH